MLYTVEKLRRLAVLIGEEYERLYNAPESIPGYREAVEEGDRFIEWNGRLMACLEEVRQDVIGSDREVAALWFALQRLEQEITKPELENRLILGETMNDILPFRAGQECEIYKADRFLPGETILYIPDVSLNEIPTDRSLTAREIEEVIYQCYSGNDFLEIAEGDDEKAEELFRYVDWQHPSAAWDAGELEDD